MTYTHTDRCAICNGRGNLGDGQGPCGVCHGTGQMEVVVEIPPPFETCAKCYGLGGLTFRGEPTADPRATNCPACFGRGQVRAVTP